MMKSKVKDILFVGATHGDEKIGVSVLKALDKNKSFTNYDWIIGNLRAFEANQRFIDADLNRSFPGKVKTKVYEEKRARDLLEITKKYKSLIDIHGADSPTGIFIIISKPTKCNLTLASNFNIENIVIWPSSTVNRSFSAFVPCGLEIECGPKKNSRIKKRLLTILKDFLRTYNFGLKGYKNDLKNKKFYYVYGKLLNYRGKKKIKSFQKITINGETFYPLLEDQYSHYKCYKMKETNINKLIEP